MVNRDTCSSIPIEFARTVNELHGSTFNTFLRERAYARLASLVSRFPWYRAECFSEQTCLQIYQMAAVRRSQSSCDDMKYLRGAQGALEQLVFEQKVLPSYLALRRWLVPLHFLD